MGCDVGNCSVSAIQVTFLLGIKAIFCFISWIVLGCLYFGSLPTAFRLLFFFSAPIGVAACFWLVDDGILYFAASHLLHQVPFRL